MNSGAGEFVDVTLGRWSSHPKFARERARWMLRAGMAFLLFGVLVLLWHAAHLDAAWFLDAIRGRSPTAIAFYLGAVGIAAFIGTGVLVVRVSVTGRLPAEGGMARISSGAYAAALFGAAAAGTALFLVPDIFPIGSTPAIELRKAAVILASLPFVLTLVLIEFLGPSPDDQTRAWRRSRGWGWAAATALTLAAAVFVASLNLAWARQLAAWPAVRGLPLLGSWLQSFTGPLLQGAIGLLAALLLLPALWLLAEWMLSGIPEDPRKRPVAAGPVEGPWWRRLGAFLRRIFGLTPGGEPEGEDDSTAGEPRPDWLDALLGQDPPPAGVIRFEVTPPRKAVRSNRTSVPDAAGDYDLLFAGLRPSTDQRDAVLHFIKSQRELHQRDGLADPTGTADFFVEGPPASGKTLTLVACAVFAAVARGERVIFLVPDDQARTDLLGRLQRVLGFSGLEWLICCEAVPAQGFLPEAGAAEPVLPDILVGTPEEWETTAFGGNPDPETRRLVLGVTTFLLDDLTSTRWTQTQTVHLPFLLDKHRLLLTAAQRRLQVVVTTRPMLKAAREALGRRLFATSEGAAVIPHAQVLRPRQGDLPWHVGVVASDPEMALASCAGCCLRQRVRPLVLLEGVSDEVRRDTIESLRSTVTQEGEETSPPPEPEVITHLYDADPARKGAWKAVFYRSSDARGLLPSLQARFGASDTAFFSIDVPAVTGEARSLDLGETPTFPILPSQFSPALLVPHLQSSAPHLPTATPVPRSALSAFGFPPAGQMTVVEPGGRPRRVGWPAFALDPAETGPLPEVEDVSQGLWSLAAFEPAGPAQVRPVKPDAMLDPRLGARLSRDGAMLFTGRTEDVPVEDRLAHWLDPHGVELGATDLSMLGDLKFRRNGVMYWAARLRVDRQNRRCIEGAFWRGNGNEASRPIFDLAVEPPAGARLVIDGPRFGGRDNLKWMSLRWETEAVSAGAGTGARAAGAMVHPTAIVTLHGAVTERGRADRYASPINFRYACSVSVLLLNPSLPTGGDLHDFLVTHLQGKWSTDNQQTERPFWPELTAALQHAVVSISPNLSSYARIATFRMPDPIGGAAVLWIEPLVTAGTALQFVEALLDDAELPRLVGERAAQALKDPAGASPNLGQNEPVDCDAARALVGRVLG